MFSSSQHPAERAMPAIIDAHHHFWDIRRNYHPWLRDEPMIPFRYGDYSAIRRNYLPEDYRRDTAGFDLIGSVYVEAEWDPLDPIGETRWVHEIAASAGLPGAVVAQAWLDREDAADVLAAQAQFELVRSIRHKPRSASEPENTSRGAAGSMDCERWRAGYAVLARHGLHFDLQTPWWHFDAAADLARDFPETRIIVNHTGLPADRSPEGLSAWRDALTRLARNDNVALKVSGIGISGERWTPALNAGVVHDAIGIFGDSRVMFASNFPVDSLVAGFSEIYSGFDQITRQYTDAQRQAMFAGNAARLYRVVTTEQ